MSDECPLYADPALYDALFPASGKAITDPVRHARIAASERFYLDEARGERRVLELGCGTGRLTVPIAEAGVSIVGVDFSASMLESARAKARSAGAAIEFIQGDMRSFELDETFSAVFIPGNSLLHMITLEDLQQCFAAVRRHLDKSGRLVFDVSKWDIGVLARDPATRFPVMTIGDIAIEEMASYDSATQVREIKWYFSRPGAPDFRVIDYRLRVIFPEELRALLDGAGFRLGQRFGEFTREAFDASSPRQVCICRPS